MTSAANDRRRTSSFMTAAAIAAACCFSTTSCRSTKKAAPTVMDSRHIVPAPYTGPRAEPGSTAAPTKRSTITYSQPAKTTPVIRKTTPVAPAPVVSAPKIKRTPKVTAAPVLQQEAPVVTPPPVVPKVSKFKPVRIIEKRQTPEPLPAPKSKKVVYTVKKGDNLWNIGRAYGVTVQEITSASNLDPNKVLKIGQKITLPAGAAYVPPSKRPVIKRKPVAKKPAPRKYAPATITRSTSNKVNAGGGKHIVQKGDSLWTIARQYNSSVKDLMALNRLSNDRLMPGQVLVVNGKAAGATTAAAPKKSTGSSAGAPPAVITINNSTTKPKAASQPAAVIDVNAGVIKNSNSGAAAPPVAVPVPAVAAATTKNLPHFVVDGDSLANIAEMYGSKVDWIKRENTGVSSDADLKPGVRLNVPVEDIER